MRPPHLLLAAILLVLAKLAAYAVVAGGDPAGPLCRYDCRWYAGIAANGYAATVHVARGLPQHAWPFFPLLPILMQAARRATGLDLAHAGCLVGSVSTILVGAVGQRYRELTRPGSRASTWLLLTAGMPFGFYFATGYAEAPYALLALLTLLGLARHEPGAASIACAFLGATRPTGILLAPAIAVASVRRAARTTSLRRRLAALLPCLISASGLFAWMAYCAVQTGDPLKFAHSQLDWGRHFADPVLVIQSAIRGSLRHHHSRGPGYEALWALAGLAIAALAAGRRRWAEAFLLAGTVLLALSSGSPGSMPRFVGAGPVFLLFAADCLDRLQSRTFRSACLAASAVLQLVLFHLWTRDWHGLI